MMPPLWLVQLGGALALAVAAWFHGHAEGAGGVQADWDAQVRADKDAADVVREVNRLASHAAATTYEAQRAAAAARVTQPSPEYRYALTATICPPAGAFGRPLELGDVPVSGAVLDRLRDAGADF